MPPKHIHRYKGVVTVPSASRLQRFKDDHGVSITLVQLSYFARLASYVVRLEPSRRIFLLSLRAPFASTVFLAPQHHRAHQLFIHTAAAMALKTTMQMTKPTASSMSIPMPSAMASAILPLHRNLNMASTLHWHADTCFERHRTFYGSDHWWAQTGAN